MRSTNGCASKLGWVILRPGLFIQNVLGQAVAIRNDNKIVTAYAKDFPLVMINVRDTGAVGARILIDPAPHVGKTSEFTGANTNDGAFTDVFSQVLGRKITYLEVTPEQNEQAMKARGMPDWLVAHLAAIARNRQERRSLHREHQTDLRHRQARAADDQTVRRGSQGVVCLTLSLPAKRGRGTARRAVEGASAKRFARPSAAFHRDRIK
jgi:hypothetical protein